MSRKKFLATLVIAGVIIGTHHVQARAMGLGNNSEAIINGLGQAPYLHLRENASTNSEILRNLSAGTYVNVISYQGNGWYKIKYNGIIGYVDGDYLKGIGSSSNSNSNNTNQTQSNTVYTNYGTTLSNYANLQNDTWNQTSANNFEEYANPYNSQTKYEFLRVNRYRNINVSGLNNMLDDMGVLQGQAQVINDAAKAYNIDPIYFAAQSILETGRGESTLAEGITIDSIANTNAPIYRGGRLVGYQMIKLPNPVTVFNLFGIGAQNNLSGFNNRALILGTTYAYQHGWTNVPNAIYGAAKFLSSMYVNNPAFNQNTPYKLRYTPTLGQIWHEYASKPYYAQTLGNLISENSYLYDNDDTFTFDRPIFN